MPDETRTEASALREALALVTMPDIHNEPALRTRNDVPMQLPRERARKLARLLKEADTLAATRQQEPAVSYTLPPEVSARIQLDPRPAVSSEALDAVLSAIESLGYCLNRDAVVEALAAQQSPSAPSREPEDVTEEMRRERIVLDWLIERECDERSRDHARRSYLSPGQFLDSTKGQAYHDGWQAGVARLSAPEQPSESPADTLHMDDVTKYTSDPGWEPTTMVVCPDCGNKRCPKANDPANACTGSNAPGQPGSAYPAPATEVDDA